MRVNKGDSLIEFQKKKVVTPKVYLAHFLFTKDIQRFRKDHTVLKINYLKTNWVKQKIYQKENFWYKRIYGLLMDYLLIKIQPQGFSQIICF